MAGNVKVTVNAAGMGEIKIDDFDLSRALRGFTLRVEAGERPTLDLDFNIAEIEVTAMGQNEDTVLVNIPDEVVRTLLLIGWQPPENDTRTYRVTRPQWEEIDSPALNEESWDINDLPGYCRCFELNHHRQYFRDGTHHEQCPVFTVDNQNPDAND